MDHLDSVALGKHVWGSLNVNLTGDAYEVVGSIPRGVGQKVRREFRKETTQKTQAEKISRENPVMQLKPCSMAGQARMAVQPQHHAQTRVATAEEPPGGGEAPQTPA